MDYNTTLAWYQFQLALAKMEAHNKATMEKVVVAHLGYEVVRKKLPCTK